MIVAYGKDVTSLRLALLLICVLLVADIIVIISGFLARTQSRAASVLEPLNPFPYTLPYPQRVRKMKEMFPSFDSETI